MSIATKKTLLLILLCGGLVRCGKEGKSAMVGVSAIPSGPIIITGDGKSATGEVLTAPWFSYRLVVNNGSPENLTIVSVRATITLSESGASSTISEFPASQLNYTAVTTTTSTPCAYLTLGEFTKSGTATDSGPLVGRLTDSSTAAPAGPCIDNFEFTMSPDSLAKPRNPNSKNYRYRVEIEPTGWFGDRDTANDRFEKKIIIYTR